MDNYSKCQQIIKEQITTNYLKNIFNIDGFLLSFNAKTTELIKNKNVLKNLTKEEKTALIDYVCDSFVNTLYNDNQYINFTKKDIDDIKIVYQKLFDDIESGIEISQIEKNHYDRITQVLISTNQMIVELNTNNEKYVHTFVCSEYSAQFQIDLFSLDLDKLNEPILDVGCGENGNLVEYLLSQGLDAYGIDRSHQDKPHFQSTNWFDYQFVENHWGTIISNLSFSNHFIKNYLNKTNIEQYAKTYMAILKSLKIGGKWYYAPSIPFVEKFLSQGTYEIVNIPINETLSKTIITRIR